MRLVAVSVVKNEADIIEAFIRHTGAFVDHHLVFDHDSTDGTRKILGALLAEGFPLSLFTDDVLTNLQQERSNHLTRLAAADFGADWVLPLDADEILTGGNRAQWEAVLADCTPDQPLALRLRNHYPSDADDAAEINPVLRLRHAQSGLSSTSKLVLPRALVLDPAVSVGKGNHTLTRHGNPVPPQGRPDEPFHLAHLALRSAEHQVLRVVLAELQKLARGRAHEGLDTHYRLGFQLLSEHPDWFLESAVRPAASLTPVSLAYRGEPLRHTESSGWGRVARALLPFLEHLARSHGALIDASPHATVTPPGVIRPLHLTADTAPQHPTAERFGGWSAATGLGAAEGPVPEAFLPVFRWGFAPETRLTVTSSDGQPAWLHLEALTYCDDQQIEIEVDGHAAHRFVFSRVNQKETLSAALALRTGANVVTFRYRHALVTPQDSRRLAVLFLRLQVFAAS